MANLSDNINVMQFFKSVSLNNCPEKTRDIPRDTNLVKSCFTKFTRQMSAILLKLDSGT